MKPSPPGRIVFAAIFVIFVYGMIAAKLGVLLPVFHLTVRQKSTIALAQAVGLIIASGLGRAGRALTDHRRDRRCRFGESGNGTAALSDCVRAHDPGQSCRPRSAENGLKTASSVGPPPTAHKP